MVNVALICIAVITPFILTIGNIMVMAYYIDHEHTKGHLFTKIMILLAMLVAECTILLLPFDVVSIITYIYIV